MNRKEYMEKLEKMVENCSSRQKSEIIADFNEHFDIGLSKGYSEEAICESLGDISDFIGDLINKEESVRALTVKQSNKITTMIVESDMSDIEIVSSDRIDCEISNWKKTDSRYYDFSKRIEEDAVIYELRRNTENGFMNFHTPDLKVKVIDGFKLKVKTTLGDIEGESLVLDEVQLITSHGDIEVELDANSAKLHTQHGDVECKGKIKQLEITTAGGDIEIESELLKNVKASSRQGDIEADIELAETVELTTQQGDIEGKINAAYLTAGSKMGDIELEVDQTRETTCETNMGDIRLTIGDIEDVEITASTKMGSIDCELEDITVNRGVYTRGNGTTQFYLKTALGDIEIEE